jgi:RNA polymerase sigma factor (sigma-70 family)
MTDRISVTPSEVYQRVYLRFFESLQLDCRTLSLNADEANDIAQTAFQTFQMQLLSASREKVPEMDSIFPHLQQLARNEIYKRVYLKFFENLRKFCQRKMNGSDEGADVAHKTFLRFRQALFSISRKEPLKLENDGKVFNFLKTTAERLVIDHYRKFRMATDIDENSIKVVVEKSFEKRIIDREFLSKILESLDTLGKAVLELTAEGLTGEEIAQILNVSLGTVNNRKKTARQKARKLMNHSKFS